MHSNCLYDEANHKKDQFVKKSVSISLEDIIFFKST